jgi:hypothetical protein
VTVNSASNGLILAALGPRHSVVVYIEKVLKIPLVGWHLKIPRSTGYTTRGVASRAYRRVALRATMPRIHGKTAESWWGSTVPATLVTNSGNAIYVGTKLKVNVPGRIMGFRQYRIGTEPPHIRFALLGLNPSHLLACKGFFDGTAPASNAWLQTWLRGAFRPVVGTIYDLVVLYGSGNYFRTNAALVAPVTHGNITYSNGYVISNINALEVALTLNTNANGVDILFQPD